MMLTEQFEVRGLGSVKPVIQNTPGIFVRVGRILYADVVLALRLVAVNLSNCCKMQNGTLIMSVYCICR